jgi:hypothetical protein
MRLLKNIGVVIVALGVFVLWGKFRHRATVEAGAAGTAAEPAVQASPYGFAPLPAPFVGPSDRLLILAPPNCPSAEGQRADELVRRLNADGIPCRRSGNAPVSAGREPTKEEFTRMDRIMRGEAPVVFINGRAKNNPDLADVEGEFRSTAN